MDPITAIATANAAILLVEKLVPIIRSAAAKGEIPKEEEVALQLRIDALRNNEGGLFNQPHWQKES